MQHKGSFSGRSKILLRKQLISAMSLFFQSEFNCKYLDFGYIVTTYIQYESWLLFYNYTWYNPLTFQLFFFVWNWNEKFWIFLLSVKMCWYTAVNFFYFQKKKLESFFLICDCNFWVFFKFNWVLPHEWVSRSARRKVWKLMD